MRPACSELSSVADDYGRYPRSQSVAFEATYSSARRFADERVLRVVDLGAADGVNPYALVRELTDPRAA